MLHVSRELIEDFKEIYDLEITSVKFRMEYEKVRNLALLNKDFEYLQRELVALQKVTSTSELVKKEKRVSGLTTAIVLLSVLGICVTSYKQVLR
jgi:hypothetical protein